MCIYIYIIPLYTQHDQSIMQSQVALLLWAASWDARDFVWTRPLQLDVLRPTRSYHRNQVKHWHLWEILGMLYDVIREFLMRFDGISRWISGIWYSVMLLMVGLLLSQYPKSNSLCNRLHACDRAEALSSCDRLKLGETPAQLGT